MSLTAILNTSTNGSRRSRSAALYAGVLLSSAIALLAAPAFGAGIPIGVAEGTLSVDGGNPVAIPIAWNDEFGVFGIGSWDSEIENFTGVTISSLGEYDIDVSGTLNPDPQISWGVTVTDFGAPSNFNFFFTTPITIGAGATTVDASISGGITDSNNSGVTITPILADFDGDGFSEIQVADVGGPTTNMGVDVGLGQTAGPPSGAYPYVGYSDGPQAGPAGPWTTLSVTVGFQLSGGGDIASMTGFAQIVPEPSSVVLLVTCLLGLVLIARRRRR